MQVGMAVGGWIDPKVGEGTVDNYSSQDLARAWEFVLTCYQMDLASLEPGIGSTAYHKAKGRIAEAGNRRRDQMARRSEHPRVDVIRKGRKVSSRPWSLGKPED